MSVYTTKEAKRWEWHPFVVILYLPSKHLPLASALLSQCVATAHWPPTKLSHLPYYSVSADIRLLCRLYRQFLFANTVSFSSLRSFLPCQYSLVRRQYEPLHVTVREVLITLRTHSANASLVFPISSAIPHPLFPLFLYNLAHQSHSYTVLLYLLFAPYRLSLPTY